MNALIALLLLAVQLVSAIAIPTPIHNSLKTALNKRDTTDCKAQVVTMTLTKTVNGSVTFITYAGYNPGICVDATATSLTTVTSTSNHCDENAHCTSTSFSTPICQNDTSDFALCSVDPTPVLTSSGSHFYVSPTTCQNPPQATGSFQCHETSTTLTIFTTSEVFTYTNCDIPDFVCPTFTTTSTTSVISITDCSSIDVYTCDVVAFTTATDASSVTFTSTSCHDVKDSTIVTTSYGPDSTLSTTITDFVPVTFNLATCPTFSSYTSTTTSSFPGCESSSILATCLIENFAVTVGTAVVTLSATSCTAGVTMSGSFVNFPSTTTVTDNTITSVITVPNIVSPSFLCASSTSWLSFDTTSIAPPPPTYSFELPSSTTSSSLSSYRPSSSVSSLSSSSSTASSSFLTSLKSLSTSIPLTCNQLYWSTSTITTMISSEVNNVTTSVFTHWDCDSSPISTSSSTRASSLPPVIIVTSTSTSTSVVPCPSSSTPLSPVTSLSYTLSETTSASNTKTSSEPNAPTSTIPDTPNTYVTDDVIPSPYQASSSTIEISSSTTSEVTSTTPELPSSKLESSSTTAEVSSSSSSTTSKMPPSTSTSSSTASSKVPNLSTASSITTVTEPVTEPVTESTTTSIVTQPNSTSEVPMQKYTTAPSETTSLISTRSTCSTSQTLDATLFTSEFVDSGVKNTPLLGVLVVMGAYLL